MVPLSELTYPQISLACTTKKVFEMIAADLDYSDENDWSLILEDDVLINPKAFPNPTNGNITISVDNFNGNIQTEVFDIIGNRLQISNETNISLRDYAKGIYTLKVAYGHSLREVKVIKE